MAPSARARSCCRTAATSKSLGSVHRTPAIRRCSPTELGSEAPKRGRSGDLFALGALLQWLITGRLPTDGEDASRPFVDERLPADVIPIVRRAVAPSSPGARYPDAGSVAQACEIARTHQNHRRPTDAETTIRDHLQTLAPPPIDDGPEAELATAIATSDDEPEPHAYRPTEVLTRLAQSAPPSATPTPPDDGGRPEDDIDDPLVGSVLHGYKLEARIGRGALAHVYRARHRVLDHLYAVKVLYGAAAVNERAQARLRREAQALSRLRHPHIVNVVDFGSTPSGLPFLTMELVVGQTLRNVIKADAPLPAQRVARIARQIADALAFAHDQGIVHRDVKPSNVMVLDPGGTTDVIKVLDFGIARVGRGEGTRLTATDALLGTPRYMAPEQITGASDVGPPADLYALGMLMYAMLAGAPPFVGATMDVVEQQLAQKPPTLPTRTGLEPLVMALLEKQPHLRPQSGRAVMQAIDNLPIEGVLVDPPRSIPPAVSRTTAATMNPPIERTAVVDPRPSPLARPSPRWSTFLPLAAAVAIGSGIATAIILTMPGPSAAPISGDEGYSPNDEPPVPPIPQVAPAAIEQPRPAADKRRPETVGREVTNTADHDAAKTRKPARAKAPARVDRVRKAYRTLAQSGLTRADVRGDPTLSEAFRALERASKADNVAAARRAEARVRRAIDGALTDARVRRRLDALADLLRKSAGSLPADVLAELEDRYLDLRASARPDGDAGRNAILLREIAAQERTLRRALAAP